MRILGNILWHFPFFGWVWSLLCALIGCLFCMTIVGIPLGMGLFQISSMLLAPFTRSAVSRSDIESVTEEKQSTGMKIWRILIRIVYFPFGLLLACQVIILVAGMFVTIIGIPCAIAYAKCIGLVFNPVGKICVPKDVADEIKRRKASKIVDGMNKSQLNGSNSTNAPLVDTAVCNSEFLVKAEAKTDEELKQIISNRMDYHPMLVKAAEKVLLERVTGQSGTAQAAQQPQQQVAPQATEESGEVKVFEV